MALCTQCGALLTDDDAQNHVCDPLDLPTAGSQIMRDGTTKAVTTGKKLV